MFDISQSEDDVLTRLATIDAAARADAQIGIALKENFMSLRISPRSLEKFAGSVAGDQGRGTACVVSAVS